MSTYTIIGHLSNHLKAIGLDWITLDYYIGLHWIGSISKAIWNIQLVLSWTLDFGTKTKRAEIFKALLAYLSVSLQK